MSAHRARLTSVKKWVVLLLKDLLGWLLVLTGLYRPLLRGKGVIVAFHSITREPSTGALRCGVVDFDAYCRFFAKHFRVETLSKTVDRIRARQSLDRNLCITFDDGYADNAELADPVLQKYKLPATFYVTSGFIESAHQTFWDQSAGLESKWMNWNQVRDLARAGHDIGAHTVTHVDLSRATNEQAETELQTCWEEIRSRIGAEPKHFAIPFGRSYENFGATISIASEIGYRSITLCRGGVVSSRSDPMSIERWPIDPLAYLSPYGWLLDVIREKGPAAVPGS